MRAVVCMVPRFDLSAKIFPVSAPEIPGAQSEAEALPPQRVWFWRGVRSALTAVQGVVLWAAFIGFGGLIRDVGFPLGAAVLSTLLIWALPAQLLVVRR